MISSHLSGDSSIASDLRRASKEELKYDEKRIKSINKN